MEVRQVEEILDRIRNVKIAVCGDFCLDAYWILDPAGGEISVETGLKTEAILNQRYSPGGASNIVANLAVLKPAFIQAIGVIGPDIFGRELQRQLNKLGADTSTLVVQSENFDTVTFSKRYLKNQEQPRIDFGFFNKRTKETDDAILSSLRFALKNYDVIIFNQQVPGSITNEDFIDECNKLFDKFNDSIVLFDSRHYGSKFQHVYRKANEVEAAQLNGIQATPGDLFSVSDLLTFAQNIYQKSKKAVFITRGARGILCIDEEGKHEIPGIQLLNKIDPVGAGDTTISTLALCLGAGQKPGVASEIANFAAAVTVQKLFTTGTASKNEILEMSKNAGFIYEPELAEDPRKAKYWLEKEIELCLPVENIVRGKIKHAVFDHDGTISTLRQGWEEIMEPVMMRAILGNLFETAEVSLYQKVHKRVLEFIDATTGIQTILQMEGLVDLVKEFGLVSEKDILDKFGYKEIYNEFLMKMVNNRIHKFKAKELDIADFTIKGAVPFLEELRKNDVVLYLASGTDRKDVLREARILGYENLFDGGIYGALGDIKKYSKKMVIEKIINENNLKSVNLAVFGDGPVEMRECRRRNGIAIGVASDEIRRYGLNHAKRTRLIKAGAQILIPDFSIKSDLFNFLFPF